MAELSVTATSLRDCAVCGKTFAPTRADAQYCSGACRQTAYRKRVTDNQVSAVPAATVTDNGDVRDAQQIEATPVSAPEPVPSAETARTPPSVTDRSPEPAGSRHCAVCGDDPYQCFPLRCPLSASTRERLH